MKSRTKKVIAALSVPTLAATVVALATLPTASPSRHEQAAPSGSLATHKAAGNDSLRDSLERQFGRVHELADAGAALEGLAGNAQASAEIPPEVQEMQQQEKIPAFTRPFAFIENIGQYPEDIAFMAQAGAYSVAVGNAQAEYYLPSSDDDGAADSDTPLAHTMPGMPHENVQEASKKNSTRNITFETIEQSFVNAANTPIKGEQKSPGHYNFYDQKSAKYKSAFGYESVVQHDIYEGIDLRWRAERGSVSGVEYDLIAGPEAKLDDVVVEVKGASSLSTDDSGNLELATDHGRLMQSRPIAWYEDDPEVPVLCSYRVIDEAHYGFEVVGRDPSRSVVIDPPVEWVAYFGGTGGEYLSTNPGSPSEWEEPACRDSVGNIYLSGNTKSPVLAGLPVPQIIFGTGSVSYLSKFSSDGVHQWTVLLTDPEYHPGLDFVVIPDILDVTWDSVTSSVVAVGHGPSIFIPPGTAPAQPTGLGGGGEGFAMKFDDSSGFLVAATYISGSGTDTPRAVTTDSLGNIYVVGTTDSTDMPVVGFGGSAPFQASKAFNVGGFVARLASNLAAYDFLTYLGGSSPLYPLGDTLTSIALYEGSLLPTGIGVPIDYIVVGGFTYSDINYPFPQTVPASPPVGGQNYAHATVSYLTLTGQLYYSWAFGGTSAQSSSVAVSNAVCTSRDGTVYVTGWTTNEQTFPTSSDGFGYNASPSGGNPSNFLRGFVVSLKGPASPTLSKATLFAKVVNVVPMAINADDNVVHITGYTTGSDKQTDHYITSHAVQPNPQPAVVDSWSFEVLASPDLTQNLYGSYIHGLKSGSCQVRSSVSRGDGGRYLIGYADKVGLGFAVQAPEISQHMGKTDHFIYLSNQGVSRFGDHTPWTYGAAHGSTILGYANKPVAGSNLKLWISGPPSGLFALIVSTQKLTPPGTLGNAALNVSVNPANSAVLYLQAPGLGDFLTVDLPLPAALSGATLYAQALTISPGTSSTSPEWTSSRGIEIPIQ